jgi:hypothetical protein
MSVSLWITTIINTSVQYFPTENRVSTHLAGRRQYCTCSRPVDPRIDDTSSSSTVLLPDDSGISYSTSMNGLQSLSSCSAFSSYRSLICLSGGWAKASTSCNGETDPGRKTVESEFPLISLFNSSSVFSPSIGGVQVVFPAFPDEKTSCPYLRPGEYP